MSDSFKPDAYCGNYCGACPSYQATRAGLEELLGLEKCKGCKSDQVSEGWCSVCDIMSCAKEKELEFCSDCSEYPCAILLDFQRNSKVPLHDEILDSLDLIKEIGRDDWLKKMEERWSCRSCGTSISYFSMYCTGCGAKVKRRRRVHRL